jgi:hypothetical protein
MSRTLTKLSMTTVTNADELEDNESRVARYSLSGKVLIQAIGTLCED